MKQRYYFHVSLSGVGSTPEEAWADAIEGFELDPSCVAEVEATEDVEPLPTGSKD